MDEETKERLSLLAEAIYLRQENIILKTIIRGVPDENKNSIR